MSDTPAVQAGSPARADSAAPAGPGDFTPAFNLEGRDHRRTKVLVLGVFAIVCFAVGLMIGAVPLSLPDLLRGSATPLEAMVFAEIRSPRVVLAACVGAVLGLAGASLQGLFRNPLADPGLIGVSAGAALGAVAMIVLGENLGAPEYLTPYLLPLAAVAGALAVTGFLYSFASWFGRFSIVTLLLVGIAVNALSTVGIGAFEYLADDRQLRSLVFWMMGSFGRANWAAAIPAVAFMLTAMLVLLTQSRALDKLQLGEADAAYLGVDVRRLKRLVILASAIAVGAGVALSGMIGFVGLVVPHLVRLLIGASHRFLLPGAALLGAGLMISADLVARTIIVPAELPVSLVTSAIGAPFFLWLVARVRPA
ncbi:MAG: iron ABC transporter permease [Pseudomonadota bacterium]